MINYFYKITNIHNDKYYYGIHRTKNINDNYLGSGRHISAAIKKYGNESFIKEILNYFDDYKDCAEFESYMVNENTIKDPLCYNIKIGGIGGFPKGKMHPLYGKPTSDKKKKQISEALKGRKRGPMKQSTKDKLSKINTGKKVSEEVRKKMSDTKKGKKAPWNSHLLSDEHKEKLKKAWIGRIVKPLTEEHKEKIRQYRIGKKTSEEVRKKISESHKGKTKIFKRKTCPFCGLTGSSPNMTRYHFNNCKKK